jgi:hypothetical protein
VDAAVGKWLSVGAGYVYSQRTTSVAGQRDYSKNEAYIKLAFTY